jgi:hypothetical protein
MSGRLSTPSSTPSLLSYPGAKRTQQGGALQGFALFEKVREYRTSQ